MNRRLWIRWMIATPETLKKPIIVCRSGGLGGFHYQVPGRASEWVSTHAEALRAVDCWWSERAS